MTTQHTQPENSDVQKTVVGQSSASETPGDLSPRQGSPTSSEGTAPAEGQVAQAPETENPTTTTETQQTFHHTSGADRPQPSMVGVSLAGTLSGGQVTLGADAGTPTVKEEVVRPFTDFIEEFRQTEDRFGPVPQEPASFSSFISSDQTAGNEFIVPWETPSFKEPTKESTATNVDATSQADPQPGRSTENDANGAQESTMQQPSVPKERPVSPLLRPATRLRMPRHGIGRQREEHPAQETRKTEGAAQPAPTDASVGAGSMRGAGSLEPWVALPGTTEQTPPQAEPVPVEEQQEQPRPARRYRFDRPAPTVSATPPSPAPAATVQARTDEGAEQQTPRQPSTHEPVTTNGAATTTVAPSQSTHDRRRRHGQVRQRQKDGGVPLQATPVSEALASVTEPGASQTQEVPPAYRSPEPQASRSVLVPPGNDAGASGPSSSLPTDFVLPAVRQAERKTAAQSAERKGGSVGGLDSKVAPEDLPPLEYSELQAATPRRRRRRRSTATNPQLASSTAHTPGTVKPVAPELPSTLGTTPSSASPSPVSPVVVPRNTTIPGNVVPSTGPYTLLSGYTVNQMNQGNDLIGPFMGPEPSPARGSTMSRDVRHMRNEAQRTPTYPARHTETTTSPASINHLGNVITQAIQAQTDRMVAELRRTNQIPTNVSVSLPPFPSTERVGVFVDVANLLYSARTLRMTVDFGKLLDFLRGNRRLVRAHAYCPTSPQPGDEQMFLQAVKGLGYRITTKNYKTFSSGAKKADLDLDLCMDVVRLVDGSAVDCIVLVSGDSDFMPMLDYCSDHGVRVEVAAFDESMSATLRQSCDLFINLSMLDEIRA